MGAVDLPDVLSHRTGSGERDRVDARVSNKTLSYLVTTTVDHIQDPGWQPGLL